MSGQRPDGYYRGLVAQEVEAALPSAVHTQREPEPLADGAALEAMKLVDMQPVTVEMAGAVKELAGRVAALRARAAALQAQLAARQQAS